MLGLFKDGKEAGVAGAEQGGQQSREEAEGQVQEGLQAVYSKGLASTLSTMENLWRPWVKQQQDPPYILKVPPTALL